MNRLEEIRAENGILHTLAIWSTYADLSKDTMSVLDEACDSMKFLLDRVEQLEKQLAAAVEDLAYLRLCRHCVNRDGFSKKTPPCDVCADNGKPNWKWHGHTSEMGDAT